MTVLSIHKVAVVGAGISGVNAAAHLLAAGLEVTVYERNNTAGGVWLYDDQQPIEPYYPATKPSQGEEVGLGSRGYDQVVLRHAPPGPCYMGLRNNVPTSLLRTTLNPWPDGTPDFVSHVVIKEYIQDTAKKAGVHDAIIYGARVTNIRKAESRWGVSWSTLHQNVETGRIEEKEETKIFDAVIVASGHYHAPRIPDIPGLSEAKTRWPSRIIHSKSYRRPEVFFGKNILMIGGGVSSIDIAREIGPHSQNILQSTRNGAFDLPSSLLPENGVRIEEIASFEIEEIDDKEKVTESDDEPIPLIVNLKSSEKLHGIHYIIICTGYHITLPFLHQFHEDDTPPADASDTVLVTDGTQIHNLHKDIFYIPDPTLAFIGVPYYTATFTLFEFQAMVVAAVFSGIAKVPSNDSMREEYKERVRRNGSGKGFHSLRDLEEVYVNDVLTWINLAREDYGLPVLEGHTPTWLKTKEAHRARLKMLRGGSIETKQIPAIFLRNKVQAA